MKNILILCLLFSTQIFSHRLEYKLVAGTSSEVDSSHKNIQISENELKKFEGVYRFAPGTEMKVYLIDSTLRATLPGQPEYNLLPSGGNIFQLKELPGYKMIFNVDTNKKIISVTSSQPNGDFTAQKISDEVVPPKEENIMVLQISKLKKFEGDYEFGTGNEMKIYLKNGDLKASVKGQSEYTLLPVSDMEFILKNVSGYKMIFEENENGEITGVISDQPNGKFKAEKIR